jgi:hypothetical protein
LSEWDSEWDSEWVNELVHRSKLRIEGSSESILGSGRKSGNSALGFRASLVEFRLTRLSIIGLPETQIQGVA